MEKKEVKFEVWNQKFHQMIKSGKDIDSAIQELDKRFDVTDTSY